MSDVRRIIQNSFAISISAFAAPLQIAITSVSLMTALRNLLGIPWSSFFQYAVDWWDAQVTEPARSVSIWIIEQIIENTNLTFADLQPILDMIETPLFEYILFGFLYFSIYARSHISHGQRIFDGGFELDRTGVTGRIGFYLFGFPLSALLVIFFWPLMIIIYVGLFRGTTEKNSTGPLLTTVVPFFVVLVLWTINDTARTLELIEAPEHQAEAFRRTGKIIVAFFGILGIATYIFDYLGSIFINRVNSFDAETVSLMPGWVPPQEMLDIVEKGLREKAHITKFVESNEPTKLRDVTYKAEFFGRLSRLSLVSFYGSAIVHSIRQQADDWNDGKEWFVSSVWLWGGYRASSFFVILVLIGWLFPAPWLASVVFLMTVLVLYRLTRNRIMLIAEEIAQTAIEECGGEIDHTREG